MNPAFDVSAIPAPHPASTGDVIRQYWPVEADKSLNLYLGTGRCGGCFDSYGLQHQDPLATAATRVSQTVLTHAEVWHRGRHGIDTLVPLTCLRWADLPPAPTRNALDAAGSGSPEKQRSATESSWAAVGKTESCIPRTARLAQFLPFVLPLRAGSPLPRASLTIRMNAILCVMESN